MLQIICAKAYKIIICTIKFRITVCVFVQEQISPPIHTKYIWNKRCSLRVWNYVYEFLVYSFILLHSILALLIFCSFRLLTCNFIFPFFSDIFVEGMKQHWMWRNGDFCLTFFFVVLCVIKGKFLFLFLSYRNIVSAFCFHFIRENKYSENEKLSRFELSQSFLCKWREMPETFTEGRVRIISLQFYFFNWTIANRKTSQSQTL